VYVTSARISGVKNFVSKAVSLLRGLPLSQVQSQSEKGAIFSFFAGAAVVPLGACKDATAGLALAAAGAASNCAGTAATAVAGIADPGCAAARLFNSASSCSMRAFITASSLAISSDISGSGFAAGRATAGAALFVAAGSLANGSCKAATFGGSLGWDPVWP
jgi:hypothetical protein